MVTAIVNDANSPTRGSTPAMIENEIASGISANATTSPAKTSVLRRRGDRSAARTELSLVDEAMVTAMRFRPDEVLILYPPVRVEYERSSHYRSEGRRVGKEGVSTFRSRGLPYNYK